MTDELGKTASKVKEKAFAGQVLIGIHVEVEVAQRGDVLVLEHSGRRDGNGLVPRRKHRQAVRNPFGDKEFFAFVQHTEDGQVVDVALRTAWETEARHPIGLAQIAALHVHELSSCIAIGNEQRRSIVERTSAPVTGHGRRDGRKSAPAHHTRVDVALVVEPAVGLVAKHRVLYQPLQPTGVGLVFALGLLCGLNGVEHDVVRIGKPAAGFAERLVEQLHRQVDGPAVPAAHEAVVAVALHAEGERRVTVGMEGAEALVAADVQPQPFGHLLDGQGAEPVDFVVRYHFLILRH